VSEPLAGPIPRCASCRDLLDEDDLFCPTCGAGTPCAEAGAAAALPARLTVHRFDCASCGASLVWTIATQGLRCTFCGRESLAPQPAATIVAPQKVCPFRIDRTQAEAALRTWLGRGFLRPGDLVRTAALTEIRALYLPCWLFAVDCDTYWTADCNATPAGARADWAPAFGARRGRYAGTLVPASGALTLAEVQSLGPYDLEAAVPCTPEILADHPVEAFGVSRKRARLAAREGIDRRLTEDCTADIPGNRHRKLKLNTLATGTTAEPVLLPAWILAFQYRGRTFRALINGATGQIAGTAPQSVAKLLALVGGGMLLVLFFLYLLALLGS
jgi:predicted RNA-binding Zn-ribbon protein involved in translation (DUF1610 family)